MSYKKIYSTPEYTPIEISTDAEMAAVLLDDTNLGKVYKFTGTSGTYINGDLYETEEFPYTKSFSQCTISELSIYAPYAPILIEYNIWELGDINNNCGVDGGIQLYHVLTEEQKDSLNTNGNIIIGSKNTLTTSKWMSSKGQQKYFNNLLHTTCNTTLYNALDEEFRNILKSWTCVVGKENTTSSSGAYGTYSQDVYLAAPALKEFGLLNGYNSDENDALFTFDYFNDSATGYERRVKSGAATLYWTRSPNRLNGSTWMCYKINASGDSQGGSVLDTTGVAVVGII